jgi:beta-aspartyl-peptidase (threonine type)
MAEVVKYKLPNGEGGIVGVDKNGEVSMQFSSMGMFRAGANSKGLRTVKIWE